MKRSLQEVVELVVFGLVALLVGTALVWVLGWVLTFGGALFKAIAGLLWLLLRFIVPIAIVAGLVYFVVKALQDRGDGGLLAGLGGGSSSQGAGSKGAGTGATSAEMPVSESREAVQNVQSVVDEMNAGGGSGPAGEGEAADRGSTWQPAPATGSSGSGDGVTGGSMAGDPLTDDAGADAFDVTDTAAGSGTGTVPGTVPEAGSDADADVDSNLGSDDDPTDPTNR